jgi:hypothetical protein
MIHDVYPGISLTDTIAAAQDGDTVIIHPGEHVGPLHLKRSIRVEGRPGNVVRVPPDMSGIIVEPSATGSTIVGVYAVREPSPERPSANAPNWKRILKSL